MGFKGWTKSAAVTSPACLFSLCGGGGAVEGSLSCSLCALLWDTLSIFDAAEREPTQSKMVFLGGDDAWRVPAATLRPLILLASSSQ